MDRIRALPRHLPFALLALALLVRVIVPAGWMPSASADGLFRITICNGMGAQTAYVDRDGKLHKEVPGGSHHDPQPCGFGALAQALDAPAVAVLAWPPAVVGIVAHAAHDAVTIGHGLAAPPPPSTGPPSLI